MPPRLLALDLDGTALRRDGTLAPLDVQAALALRRAGVIVTIVTGRLFSGTRWVARELGIGGLVAVMNGCEVVEVDSGRVHHGRYLGGESLDLLRATLPTARVASTLFRSGGIHHGHDSVGHRPAYALWTTEVFAHDDIYALPGWGGDDILGVGVVGPGPVISELRGALIPRLGNSVGAMEFPLSTGGQFLALHRAEDDKGTGLERIAASHGLALDDCVAVGDWINDYAFLGAAGRSFAMAHAPDSLKAVADEVLDADTVRGGAIAEVARRVWGI